MPILMTTPDISAETWLGAAACAAGSQECSGIAPALMPKASEREQEERRARAGAGRGRQRVEGEQPPV